MPNSAKVSGPSQAALDHSCADQYDIFGDGAPSYSPELEAAVKLAHDPVLGLDRSVCLRDVVEWLRERDAEQRKAGLVECNSPGIYADVVEREFGAQGA